MRLTKKDVMATAVMAVIGTVYLAVAKGWDWPLLESYRTGAVALGLIGMMACAAWAEPIESLTQDGFVIAASVLGAGSMILVIATVITGSSITFTALAIDIVLLYVVATVHHLTSGRHDEPRGLTPAEGVWR